VTTQKRRG